VQEYYFFSPIHINCHNNTKDIKKKPPHLLSFCDCEKSSSQRESSHHASGLDGSCYCSRVCFGGNANHRVRASYINTIADFYSFIIWSCHSHGNRSFTINVSEQRVCRRGCEPGLSDSSRIAREPQSCPTCVLVCFSLGSRGWSRPTGAVTRSTIHSTFHPMCQCL